MADFYTSLSNTAKALINDKGKDVTFTRQTGGTYDPVTGSYSGNTPEQQTIKAVVLPAQKSKVAGLDVQYGLGGAVFDRYNFLMVSGQDVTFEPEPGQTVLIGSETWTVLGVTPTNPNDGSPMVYDVALRI